MCVRKPYVAVVGAVNMDIWARSRAPLIARDSNPGEMRLSPGGVGWNIAHNLRLLDTAVGFVTALGEDDWAPQLVRRAQELDIDLSHAVMVPGGRTGAYVCLSGPEGEMSVALSDMDITAHITPALVTRQLAYLNGAACVAFDGNLPAETIQTLAAQVSVPLFADPVSVTKSQKLGPVLDRLHTLKPNVLEAEALTGAGGPVDCAAALCRLGVRRAFVSDGANGLYACEGGPVQHFACCRSEVKNVTGGGDAVVAALIRAYLDGLPLAESARFALAAGALATECEDTINPALSIPAILARQG